MTDQFNPKSEIYSINALYDLSLDIAQHEADVDFSDNDNTIHYIFDENLFELFVAPYENHRGFDHSFGLGATIGTQQDDDRGVTSMQTALLASEALFGGKLPGQKMKRVHMTEWHRWELLSRMTELYKKYIKQDISAFKVAAGSLIREKLNFWKSTAASTDTTQYNNFDDPWLAGDIAYLRQSKDIDENIIHSFIRNRELATLLARDKLVEPMQQLSRIFEPAIWSYIHDSSSIRRPKQADLEAVESSAAQWFRRIRNEVDAHQLRSYSVQHRSAQSLWNDARSLAIIEWYSGLLDPRRERIAFITGDVALFDAYRRRFEDQSKRSRPSTNAMFLLRRPVQYSPLFLEELRSVGAPHKERVFYSVQQAAELALVPVRLAALTSDMSIPSFATFIEKRRSLTLLPIDYRAQDALSELDQFWLEHRTQFKAEKVDAVDAALNLSERLLVGLSRETLLRRLSKEEISLFSTAGGAWGAEQEMLIEKHLKQTVQRLVTSAIEVWKPIAEAFFDSNITVGVFSGTNRVPLAVRLASPEGTTGTELIRRLLLLRSGAPEVKSSGDPNVAQGLLNTTFYVFIASGVLALTTHQWAMADHFCEIAINALEYIDPNQLISASAACEAYYLAALSKRFRIGRLNYTSDKADWYECQRLFDAAEGALLKSEVFARKSDKAVGSGDFLAFRINSERAALNLFFAEACWTQSQLSTNVGDKAKTESRAKDAMLHAANLLSECLRIERRSRKDDFSLASMDQSVQFLRRQYLVNVSAIYVLAYIFFGKDFDFGHGELKSDLIRNMADVSELLRRANGKLLKLELISFKLLYGIDVDASKAALAELKSLPSDAISSLAVDARISQLLEKARFHGSISRENE